MRAAPRLVLLSTAAALVCVVMTGCRAEPAPTASPGTPEPTPSITQPTTGPSPSPIETNLPQSIELPSSCEDIYSDQMLAALQEQNPPLNDPGVTMLPTENADLLEILESGAPTLRCTWGQPSEFGLATNVTLVDEEQAAGVLESLRAAGFGCEDVAAGESCEIEQRGVTFDDVEYVRGETHVVGDGAWVATAWINFHPDGYSTDIAAQLWP